MMENQRRLKQWEKDGKRRIEMTEDNGAETIIVNDRKSSLYIIYRIKQRCSLV